MTSNPENNRGLRLNRTVMEQMIKEDPFLLMCYNTLNATHEQKVKLLFNTYIVDSYDMRQRYREIARVMNGNQSRKWGMSG